MSPLTESMRRLRTAPDVFFVSVSQGAWLRNARGSMVIRGQHAYPLVEWLLPRLDGQTDLDDLLRDLDPARQRAVQGVLDTLLARGFVQSVGPRTAPPEEWADLFGEQLAFLDYYVPDPVDRFAAFRAGQISVIGQGGLLRAVVASLCEMGTSSLSIVPVPETAGAALSDLVRAARGRDRGLDARILPPVPDLIAAARQAATSGAETIVVASDELSIGQLPAVAPASGRFACLLVRRGLVFSAVFNGRGGSGCIPCPSCLDRAVAGEASVILSQDAPPPAASLAAHDVATSLFLDVTGLAAPSSVATIDASDLSLRRHDVPGHPECTTCLPGGEPAGEEAAADGLVRPAIPGPSASPELSAAQDQIVTRIAAMTDPVVGPLLESGEDDISQLPDAASGVLVRARHSRSAAPETARLLVTALSAREARNQAALFAAERWLPASSPGLAVTSLSQAVLRGAGAGWSQAEAGYRALLGASLSWALATGQVAESVPVDVSEASEPLVRHLCGLLADSGVGVCRAACYRAPTGMVIATFSGLVDSEPVPAAGLTQADALATLLAGRLGSLRGQPGSRATWLTAVTPPPCETWAAALERARSAATAREVTVHHLPSPFPAGIAAAQAVVRC